MSSQSQTNGDKARRKRQSRNKNVATNSASADETMSADSNSNAPKSRSEHKKKKSHKTVTESALSQQIGELNEAVTPPRSNSRNQIATDTNGQKSNHKKATTQNEQAINISGHRKSKAHHATNNSNTPSKPVMEAAYAGPTFHASPAPSALPIPKFLSKSAPSHEPEVGISARLAQDRQDEDTGSGSDQASESPLRHISVKPATAISPAPQPALFDVLINADRQEKARQRAEQNQSPMRAAENASSSTPGLQRPSHGRTLTAGSVFPMDIDASSGRSTPASVSHQSNRPTRHESPALNVQPRPLGVNDDSLKRMLFSSPQSIPNGQSSHLYTGPLNSSPAWVSSPASNANTSPYGTPPSTSSVNGLAASSRPAPTSPYNQMSPSPAARRSNYSQNNSGLRREVSPIQHNLYGTPPYLSAHGYPEARYSHNSSPLGSPVNQRFPAIHQYGGTANISPYGSHAYNSPARNQSPAGNHGAYPSGHFSAQDALKVSLGKDSSSEAFNVTGMENELRKILRLDDLRATTTAAPQN